VQWIFIYDNKLLLIVTRTMAKSSIISWIINLRFLLIEAGLLGHQTLAAN